MPTKRRSISAISRKTGSQSDDDDEVFSEEEASDGSNYSDNDSSDDSYVKTTKKPFKKPRGSKSPAKSESAKHVVIDVDDSASSDNNAASSAKNVSGTRAKIRASPKKAGTIKSEALQASSSKPAPKSPSKKLKSPPSTSKKKALVPANVKDAFDVHLPPIFASGNNGECSLLLQLDPDDAATLDYTGLSGAIGRLEADDHGVTLDFKGSQYHGSILPGPTALVVGFKSGHLKVEGITDEFARLVKTQDVMAKLDAVVQGNMDDGFHVEDENVNRIRNDKQKQDGNGSEEQPKAPKGNGKKRASTGGAKQPAFQPPATASRRKASVGSSTKKRKRVSKK